MYNTITTNAPASSYTLTIPDAVCDVYSSTEYLNTIGTYPVSGSTCCGCSDTQIKEKEKPMPPKEKPQSFEVDRIDFGRKTTVYWQDGTETTVRCARDTEFSEYSAFTAALAKKIYKTNTAITRIVKDKDLREIRRKQKEENLKAQAERERIAAKKRKARIKKMARKMKEEAEARALAEGKE